MSGGWCAAALSKAINDSPSSDAGRHDASVDEIPDFHEFLQRDANFYDFSILLLDPFDFGFKFRWNFFENIFEMCIRMKKEE